MNPRQPEEAKMNNDYLLNLLEQGKRADGRKLEDYRKITIETGISKNAEGSARCKIGDTEVLAGVMKGALLLQLN